MKLPIEFSSLIILTGGLGSGKTELAANLSFSISEDKKQTVHLVDLDNIKPYFKARNLMADYGRAGIKIVAPPNEYLFSDLPLLPPEARNIIAKKDLLSIVDVGGDESGARVLRGYREEILARNHDFLFVLNKCRPYPNNPQGIAEMIRNIESVSGLKITGIVNNTHLLSETEPKVVYEGYETALAVSDITGIPFLFNCVRADLDIPGLKNIYKLNLYFSDMTDYWAGKNLQ